jgi:hypothetical protein
MYAEIAASGGTNNINAVTRVGSPRRIIHISKPCAAIEAVEDGEAQ